MTRGVGPIYGFLKPCAWWLEILIKTVWPNETAQRNKKASTGSPSVCRYFRVTDCYKTLMT